MEKSGAIVGNGIVEQFERALSNLLISLKESGGAPSSLTKLTIFSVDPADYRAHAKEIGAVWKKLVGKDYPAMTLVGVTRLWDKEALIEIEGYAAI
jgi:enamine deaminase RidA (YjgF/YER057c/UK114 family)